MVQRCRSGLYEVRMKQPSPKAKRTPLPVGGGEMPSMQCMAALMYTPVGHHQVRTGASSDDALQGTRGAHQQVPPALTLASGGDVGLKRVGEVWLGVHLPSHVEREPRQRAVVPLHPAGVVLDGDVQHFTDDLRALRGAYQGAGDDQVEGDGGALPLLSP